MSTNREWLELSVEETLAPHLPIIDPHHHLWEFRPDGVSPRYLMDEFQADLGAGHNIVATVFIECGTMYKTDGPEGLRSVGEMEFANGIAAMSASGMYGATRIGAGLIGNADLCLGAAVGEVLDALAVAGGGRFRGIRDQANWEADEGIRNGRFVTGPHAYMDPKFREGFPELAKRDLSFEAWCFHSQITELTDLARTFPDTRIVLNHFGGPLGVGPYAGKQDEIFEVWKADVAELAGCPNVHAKLGGINMDINGFGWEDRDRPPESGTLMDATRRFYDHAISCFGVDRCMFESNFPVDKLSCSYNTLWNSFKRLTDDFSVDERAALFHDTANRFYRLGL
jgi:predicted TIM-barrel fold metal-dependent hydrolase